MLAVDGYGLLPVTAVDAGQYQAFDCGRAHLNEFLTTIARPMHEQRLGLTSLVFHRDVEGAIGYFTLCNDSIPLSTGEVFDLGMDEELKVSAFPAVKIGRLAVTHEHQSSGVGAEVMKLIFGEVLDSSSLSAARFLVVDADNQTRVVNFYERQGFERSMWAERQARNHRNKKAPDTIKMLRDLLR